MVSECYSAYVIFVNEISKNGLQLNVVTKKYVY